MENGPFPEEYSFLNRKGKKFDLDNNTLADLKVVDEQPKLIHPGITSEIPGIETEDMYDGTIEWFPIDKEEKPPCYTKRAAKAHNNSGLDTINQIRGVHKKHYEVIVVDGNNNDTDGNLVWGVSVKEDPVDHFLVSGEYTCPGQEMVILNFKKRPIIQQGGTLGYSKQTIIPRMLFSPKTKGKTHGSKVTTEVGFLLR